MDECCSMEMVACKLSNQRNIGNIKERSLFERESENNCKSRAL